MRTPLHRLPSLDLLRGFEAAARHLSFTRAAAELHVTQSAVSRQIKTLEDHLDAKLFARFNSALKLTADGESLYATAQVALRQIEEGIARIGARGDARLLTVTTTVSFAALWLVPRLARFRKIHPGVDVRLAATNDLTNLGRERIDIAIRFMEPRAAPAGSLPLTGEEVFPVCSPALARSRAPPLKKPADLARHVLLHVDDPTGQWPWLAWDQWLAANSLAELKPAGVARYSHYDQLIQAAVAGEGVALGRTPLVLRFLKNGTLAAPFRGRLAGTREYFIIVAPHAAARAPAQRFVAWLQDEIRQQP
jgi:LysR family glycine cleavage system transcriptional activator